MPSNVVKLPNRRELAAAAASDRGRQRENNEDAVLCDPARGLFAVVDGVGGEAAGETSSKTAVEILRRRLSRRDPDQLAAQLRDAITHANNRIFEMAQRDEQLLGMACVLSVALVDGDRLLVGHVGDTRVYRLRPGTIEKLTRDHSPIGAMEDRREIAELEAMRHPRRNEIYRDVGSVRRRPDDQEFVDVVEARFEPDQAILLCSDGLSDQLTSREILDLVEDHAGDPESTVARLISRANQAGGRDNVSVVLVEGERFASAVAREVSSASAPTVAPRAAGISGDRTAPRPDPPPSSPPIGRPQRVARVRAVRPGWRVSGALAVLLLVTLGAALFAPATWWPRWAAPARDRVASLRFLPSKVLRVGPGKAFATISAALAAARRGQRIEVEPGTYAEALELKNGVELTSRVPRAAVLVVSSEGTAEESVGILATGIHGAAVRGFRIEGGPGAGSTVGLRLVASAVEVESLEVSGMTGAAISILGEDRSTVHYSHLHDNPGPAIVVGGSAAPRILDCLIERSGGADAALEILDQAAPTVVGNRFDANRTHARTRDPARVAEIRQLNRWSGDPDAAIVVLEPAPAAARTPGTP